MAMEEKNKELQEAFIAINKKVDQTIIRITTLEKRVDYQNQISNQTIDIIDRLVKIIREEK